MVAEDIKFIIPRNSIADVLKDTLYSGKRRWLESLTYPMNGCSILDEGSGEL